MSQLDNRGSTFYIARYWAEAMAKHDPSFKGLSEALSANEAKIVKELEARGLIATRVAPVGSGRGRTTHVTMPTVLPADLIPRIEDAVPRRRR